MSDLERLLSYIEAGLSRLPFETLVPASLYQPMSYILASKAKRMRPLLVLMAYEIYKPEQAEKVVPLALAVELFHNFTLVHDDIMDNAPTRRGRATVHTRWDINTAILSGDAMFAYTMKLIADAFPEKAAHLLGCYAQTALEVCEGQAQDMALANEQHVTVELYLEMIRKKTAVLLGCSLALGAIAADAPTHEVNQLQLFGQQAGLAFQLQDDLLDVFADQAQFGKQPGGDIIENKKTFLMLTALNRANPEQAQALAHWLSITGIHPEKVDAVRKIYRQLDIESTTRQLIKHYFEQALDTIQPFMNRPSIKPLMNLIENLSARQT